MDDGSRRSPSDPSARANDEASLQALIDVLRVATRHDNLLMRPAFDEVAEALGRHIPFTRLAVMTYEPEGGRVYAMTRDVHDAVVPFGQLFPIFADEERLRALHADVFYCDDTRLGTDLDRRTGEAGMLSYLTLPIGPVRPEVQALLVLAFPAVAQARTTPLPLLREVGALFGRNFARAMASARQRRLAMILETSGDAMLAWDQGGRITDANAAAAGLTGVARAALIGSPIADLFGEVPDPARSQDGVRLELAVRGPGSATKAIVSATITAVHDDPQVAAHALLRDRSAVALAEREAELHLGRVRELEQEHSSLLDMSASSAPRRPSASCS
ncbi:MAG: PAS domain-containing protein [Polyangiaceae bacterium]